VTDRNVYVARRRRGGRMSVLFKGPLGATPVEPRKRKFVGRYLAIGDQRIWMLAQPDTIEAALAIANGR
jgi:hypothetical protein